MAAHPACGRDHGIARSGSCVPTGQLRGAGLGTSVRPRRPVDDDRRLPACLLGPFPGDLIMELIGDRWSAFPVGSGRLGRFAGTAVPVPGRSGCSGRSCCCFGLSGRSGRFRLFWPVRPFWPGRGAAGGLAADPAGTVSAARASGPTGTVLAGTAADRGVAAPSEEGPRHRARSRPSGPDTRRWSVPGRWWPSEPRPPGWPHRPTGRGCRRQRWPRWRAPRPRSSGRRYAGRPAADPRHPAGAPRRRPARPIPAR